MGTLLTKVFQRAAGWWKAADTALQTILPELTTESVPSRLVRFTPVNVLPVNFSYLKNDGIERLFFDSNKSGTAEVSLLSLKNKRQEFFFAPKVLSGGQTDRVLARRAVCTSDNQASMSKQGDSPDYECRLRLREHAVRSNLLSRTVRSNLLSHTLPTPPSIP